MRYIPLDKFCIAVVVGIIFSFFIVAMMASQPVEPAPVTIKMVATPEPVYGGEVSEPDTNIQDGNSSDSKLRDISTRSIILTWFMFVALFLILLYICYSIIATISVYLYM